MSIELHIERLVIDAVLLGGEHPHNVRRALEHELAQRLAQPGAAGTLRQLGAAAMLPSATLPATAHQGERAGAWIAAVVGRTLGVNTQASPGRQPAHRGDARA